MVGCRLLVVAVSQLLEGFLFHNRVFLLTADPGMVCLSGCGVKKYQVRQSCQCLRKIQLVLIQLNVKNILGWHDFLGSHAVHARCFVSTSFANVVV